MRRNVSAGGGERGGAEALPEPYAQFSAADDPYPTLLHDLALTPRGRLIRMPRQHTAG